MVRIGIAGIGFMGMIHYLASRNLNGAQVVAISSRDQSKLDGDWRSIRGNFGPPGEQMDLSHLKKFTSYDEMLADPDIDMVDVCNPTHLHPEFAIKALQAGKDVFVEKAISLTTEDADRMLDAAAKAGKRLMVAHVLPFFPEFQFAANAVKSGEYGKLLAAHFTRVIAKPEWSADISDASKTGGPAVDLHIHDTHFIGLICGIPNKVFATGLREGDAVNYLTTSYIYGADGPAVSCSSGAVATAGREFVHGYQLYLEKATIAFDSGGTPLTVYTADGKSFSPELPGGGDPIGAFTMELQAAVDGVKAGQEPDLLSAKLARDALLLCHKECESVKTGQIVDIG